MPAHEWIREQFTFENDAELKWQIDVQDRYIERRCVGDGINTGFGCVDALLILVSTTHVGEVVHARDFYRRQNRLHDEPRPETGKDILHAPVTVEERAQQRKRAQNNGVSPDQRGKNEIRAQATEPAMA